MVELVSCPWGPVTANGVDLLTKMYVIYSGSRCYGRLEGRKEGRKEGRRKARKYIMMVACNYLWEGKAGNLRGITSMKDRVISRGRVIQEHWHLISLVVAFLVIGTYVICLLPA